MKKVSIIIPCYNCATTLRRCLDSVFSQTYRNIEVIAINDGSKDNTLEILKEYDKKYTNLKIIDKANNGVSSARNDGMEIATGDYIQFLDSDDNFLYNNVVEKNVKLLEKYKVDAVVFNFTHPCFQTHLSSGVYDLRKKSHFKKYYQDFFFSSMPWNKLLRREVITEKYDESMAFAEDELFNLANMKNMGRIYISDEVVHNYYCEPVVSKERASAINKLYIEDDFWLKKDAIWYKCIKNIAKRDAVFASFQQDDYAHLKYVRPFDFFFYDFAFMCHLNTSVENEKKQCVDCIVQEEEFFNILKSKEAFGLKLKTENPSLLARCMEKFVELGNKAFHMNRNGKLGLKLYKVLFGIFGRCFYNVWSMLNEEDILAETMIDLQEGITNEAVFVNELLGEDDEFTLLQNLQTQENGQLISVI